MEDRLLELADGFPHLRFVPTVKRTQAKSRFMLESGLGELWLTS